MENILAELQKYLTFSKELQNREFDLSLKAAQAFCNLITQASTVIGLEMHRFVPPCFVMVSHYVQNAKSPSSSTLLPYMYNVVTHLMAAHPEHCLNSLKEHSKILLTFAKQMFPPSHGIQRDALIDYFSAHLQVCEMAAELQGLSRGELGYLKSATLDEQQLSHLLQIIASEQQLKKFPTSVDGATMVNKHGGGRIRVGQGSANHPAFVPLTRRHQRYLELVARLLKYSQSMYVVKAKLKSLKDQLVTLLCPMPEEYNVLFPPQTATSLCDTIQQALSEAVTPDLASSCPWGQTIFKNASFGYQEAQESLPASQSNSQQHLTRDDYSQVAGTQSIATVIPRNRKPASSRPITNTADPNYMVACLQIISACAEAFPGGECWSTIVVNHSEPISDDEHTHLQHYGERCSSLDLSAIVSGVATLLEQHGTLDGHSGVQVWSLVALRKLTIPTYLKSFGRQRGDEELALAWQRVWECILRQDLRYSSFTSNTSSNSAGELVLLLLASIIEYKCTSTSRGVISGEDECEIESLESNDPFLQIHQHNIWSLAVFQDATSVHTGAVFELISAVESSIGISNNGDDRIDTDSVLIPVNLQTEHFAKDRRYKLCLFCVGVIESNIDSLGATREPSVLPMASECLSVLLNRKVHSQIASTNLLNRFVCTADEVCLDDLRRTHDRIPFMWKALLIPSHTTHYLIDDDEHTWRITEGLGPRLSSSYGAAVRKLVYLNQLKQLNLRNSKSRRLFTGSPLHRFAVSCLKYFMSHIDGQGDSEEEKEYVQDQGIQVTKEFDPLFSQVLCLAVILNIEQEFCPNTDSLEVEKTVCEIINRFSKEFTENPKKDDSFANICACMIGVFRSLSQRQVSTKWQPSSDLRLQLRGLVVKALKLLESYEEFRNLEAEDESDSSDGESRTIRRQRNDSFSSDDEHVSISKKPAKTPSIGLHKKRRLGRVTTSSVGPSKMTQARTVDEPICRFDVYEWCIRILVALDPSPQFCDIALESLISSAGEEGSVTVPKSKSLSMIMCSLGSTLGRGYPENVDEWISVASTCIESILNGRQCTRVASTSVLFGFDMCAEIISNPIYGEAIKRGRKDLQQKCIAAIHPTSSTSLFKDLAKNGRRALSSRPNLRVMQLKAVTTAFLEGGAGFHLDFDEFFPPDFVLPALTDISYPVRNVGSVAVAATLKILPNERRIVDAVVQTMFPLDMLLKDDQVSKDFGEWISDLGTDTDGNALDLNRWHDSFDSLILTSIRTIGQILQACSSDEIRRDKIYLLLELSSVKPHLEFICFSVLRLSAAKLGHGTVRELIAIHEEWILSRWIAEGKEFSALPLSMCDPDVLETLMNLGVAWTMRISEKQFGDLLLDVAEVRGEAISNYIFRAASALIPVIILSEGSENRELNDTKSKSQRWKYLLEACYFLTGSEDDSTIARIIVRHLPDIDAYVFPMLQPNCSDDIRRKGEDGQAYVRELVSNDKLEKQRQKLSYKSILRILDLGGRAPRFWRRHGDTQIPSEAYIEAVRSISRMMSAGDFATNVFELAGTSTAECILNCKNWLDLTSKGPDSVLRWNMIKFIGDELLIVQKDNPASTAEFAICLNTMMSILLDSKHEELHSAVLLQVYSWIQSLVSRLDNITAVINMIVSCVFQIRENVKNHVNKMCLPSNHKPTSFTNEIPLCYSRANAERINMHDTKVSAAPESSVCEELSKIPEFSRAFGMLDKESDKYEIMRITVSLLRLLLEGRSDAIKATLYPFPYIQDKLREDAIASEASLLSVRDIVHNFNQLPSEFWEEIEYFNNFSNQFFSKPSSFLFQNGLQHRHTCAVHRLRLCLTENQAALMKLLSSKKQNPEIRLMIFALSEYCRGKFSLYLRSMASECLGELLNCTVIESSIDLDHRLRDDTFLQSSDHDDPTLIMKLRALELLCSQMLSNDTKIALTSLETLRAILSTEEGITCWQSMTDPLKRSIVKPLVRTRQRINPYNFPARFISHLKRGKHQLKDNTGSWCWDPSFWDSDGKSKNFETLICDLVCAMLCCCTHSKAKKDSSNTNICLESELLSCCAGISALSSDFAEVIFPAIIFDLLSNEEEDRDDSVGSEIWVPNKNAKDVISNCFSGFLVKTEDSIKIRKNEPEKFVVLLTKTLIFLFRYTQDFFLSHDSPSSSVNSLPNRIYSDQTSPVGRQSNNQPNNEKDYNENLEPAPAWRGLPYGVALRLDDLDISAACLSSQQPASALLFADVFADNNLSGSGAVFERLASLKVSQRPIFEQSPSTSQLEKATKSGDSCEMNKGLMLARMARLCYQDLGDKDAVKGLDSQLLAITLNSDHENGKKVYNWHVNEDRLSTLDIMAQSGSFGEFNASSNTETAIAASLNKIGLRHVMQNYLVGMNTLNSRIPSSSYEFSDHDKETLKELWFQDSWRQLLWDDCDTVSRKILRENGESYLNLDGDKRGFHKSVCCAFQCLWSDDISGCRDYVQHARATVLMEMSRDIGLEANFASNFPFIVKFRLLNDLSTISASLDNISSRDVIEVVEPILKRIDETSNMQMSEMVCSANEVILKVLGDKLREKSGHQDFLLQYRKYFFNAAIKAGRSEIAESCLVRLKESVSNKFNENTRVQMSKILLLPLEVKLAEAKLMNLHQDFSGSIRVAKLILSQLERELNEVNQNSIETDRLIADVLDACGLWVSHHRIESAKVVLENYLRPASVISERIYTASGSTSDLNRAVGAHLNMADFVTNIFESVLKRVTSIEWKRAGIAAEKRVLELEKSKEMYSEARDKYQRASNKKGGSKSRKSNDGQRDLLAVLESECHDLIIHIKVLEREVDIDRKERRSVEQQLKDFLSLALESYESGLALSGTKTNESDESIVKHVFRLVSLWFSNQTSERANQVFESITEKVPSFRFVPLIYQIFSRLDQEGTQNFALRFQNVLRKLCILICSDHPYHAIVQLIALSNGNKVGSGVGGRQSSAYLDNVGGSKVEAARIVIEILRKSDSQDVSSLIEAYNSLVNSYIDLAMAPTEWFQNGGRVQTKEIPMSLAYPSRNKGSVSLDRVLGSSKQKTFSVQPCILTKPPHIRPMADYGERSSDPIGTERIESFDSVFDLTETGLHRPKIVVCIGSKGTKFKQLVKGEDDIRQDAIMEQVFTTVNRILRSKSNEPGLEGGTQRNLSIATYNIVPLSPASGVLEWVDNTLPFGEYLIDRPKTRYRKGALGAHSRYYPGEWSNNLCRTHLRNAPAPVKREAFDVVCKHFSPAFRFFFLEKFSESSQVWHNAKMKYTRSCAVSSIVGHILGIGDRHCHNILVHEKTGEVVHIDFGIVFDQGKVS